MELPPQVHQDNEKRYEERFNHLESLMDRIIAVSETLAGIAATTSAESGESREQRSVSSAV